MRITLALESAIAGGSISLLDGEDEIGRWIGASDVSKAEDLLINIDALLKKNSVTRNDIGLIAISAGPGSFTGIRIGFASAMGLRDGLGVRLQSVLALAAIAASTAGKTANVAVPMGRNSICLQPLSDKEVMPPYVLDRQRFVELVRNESQSRYVVHEKLYTDELRLTNIANFGSNVAKAVGLYAIRNPNITAEPQFISKAI